MRESNPLHEQAGVLENLERINDLLHGFDASHASRKDDSTEYRRALDSLQEAGYVPIEQSLWDDDGEYVGRVWSIYPKKFAERG